MGKYICPNCGSEHVQSYRMAYENTPDSNFSYKSSFAHPTDESFMGCFPGFGCMSIILIMGAFQGFFYLVLGSYKVGVLILVAVCIIWHISNKQHNKSKKISNKKYKAEKDIYNHSFICQTCGHRFVSR